MVFEVNEVLSATSVWSTKLNASGALGKASDAASVVVMKVSETPPMVSTVYTEVA